MEHREDPRISESEEIIDGPQPTFTPSGVVDLSRPEGLRTTVVVGEASESLKPRLLEGQDTEEIEEAVVPDCLIKLKLTPELTGMSQQDQYRGIWVAYFVRKDWCVGANRRKLTQIFSSFFLLDIGPCSNIFPNATLEFKRTLTHLASDYYMLVPIRVMKNNDSVELIGIKLNKYSTRARGCRLDNDRLHIVDRCFNGIWVTHPTVAGYNKMSYSRGVVHRKMLEAYTQGGVAIDNYVLNTISALGGLF